jgi:hypothetical protein
MAETTITVRATRRQVKAMLRTIVSELTGGEAATSPGASTVLVRLGLAVQRVVHRQFALKSFGGTDESGIRWWPLARFTLKQRRRRGNLNTDILHDSGELETSIAPAIFPEQAGPTPPTVPMQVFTVAPGEVKVGTIREGAADHHHGTPELPQRRLWPQPSQWSERMDEEVMTEVRSGMVALILDRLRKMV